MRAALNGQWELAFYLNPLAYPAVLAALLAAALLLFEAVRGTPLWNWELCFQRAARIAPLLVVLALSWWTWHVVAALKTPKPELVNFRNPVAARLAESLKPPGN